MQAVRTLLVSSAVGLMAAGLAQAADLPVKAKPVEYVRICSLYGAGFFFIPGTDTCIKIGGYLRADTTFNAGGAHGQPAWNGDPGQQNRFRDYFIDRSRMVLSVDTRTATEYGVVRTFGSAKFQFNNFSTSNPSNSIGNAAGLNANLLSTAGGGYVAIYDLFIQFAGFTFGKSASAFASPWQVTPGNLTSFLLGGHTGDNSGPNNIQYMAEFGNGVSATIGLDDPTVWDRTAVYNLAIPGAISANGAGSNAYAGTHAPEIVGNIRVDQAWGLFQISAAAHEVNGAYDVLGAGGVPTALSEISGHPETKWGGAVMAALQLKNLPTGKGDDIKVDASFAKGATKYVISSDATSPSFAMFSGSGFGYQSVGFGATTDGVYMPGALGTGGIVLTQAWGIRGAFNHNWDAYWITSLFGSYSSVRYSGGSNDNINGLGTTTAKGAYCAAFAASHPGQAAIGNTTGNYTCNPDFNVAQLGTVTRWTPVKNLTFSAEVMWTHLDQKMAGSSVFTATAPKPVALYAFKDQDTFQLELRAQRNF
jgi:hypothetical protein